MLGQKLLQPTEAAAVSFVKSSYFYQQGFQPDPIRFLKLVEPFLDKGVPNPLAAAVPDADEALALVVKKALGKISKLADNSRASAIPKSLALQRPELSLPTVQNLVTDLVRSKAANRLEVCVRALALLPELHAAVGGADGRSEKAEIFELKKLEWELDLFHLPTGKLGSFAKLVKNAGGGAVGGVANEGNKQVGGWHRRAEVIGSTVVQVGDEGGLQFF